MFATTDLMLCADLPASHWPESCLVGLTGNPSAGTAYQMKDWRHRVCPPALRPGRPISECRGSYQVINTAIWMWSISVLWGILLISLLCSELECLTHQVKVKPKGVLSCHWELTSLLLVFYLSWFNKQQSLPVAEGNTFFYELWSHLRSLWKTFTS